MAEYNNDDDFFPEGTWVEKDTPAKEVEEKVEETKAEEPVKQEVSETPEVEATEKVEEASEQVEEKKEKRVVEPVTSEEERSLEKKELSDEDFLAFARERYGIESLEDIKGGQTQEKESAFADPFVETLNKYIAETGRSWQDYIRTQTYNVDELSSEQIVKAGLREDNPNLNDSQIEKLYKAEFGQRQLKEIDEEVMDDDEVQAIKNAQEENEIRQIRLEQKAQQYRQTFKDLQEKYRLPQENSTGGQPEEVENDFSFDTEEFKKTSTEAIAELESIELDDFEFKLDDRLKSKVSENFFTPEDFMAQFVDEQGNFNASDWAGFVASQILENDFYSAVSKSKSDSAVENVVKEMKSTTLDSKETPQTAEKVVKSISDAFYD